MESFQYIIPKKTKITTFHLYPDQTLWLTSIVPKHKPRSAVLMYLAQRYLKTLHFEALFIPTIITPIALCQISVDPLQIQFSDGSIKHLVFKGARSI
jgi:hypothetical protein